MNITVKGRQVTRKEAPILVVAPHSTFLDASITYVTGFPSIIVRRESGLNPFIGKLINYTQPVYVWREDPNSRQNTIKEIIERVNSDLDWPQVLIFPEGTCTNRSCLITFKPGAFYPGVPVQPVCIRYPNKLDTVTWTWEGPGALKLLWLTLTQVQSSCEIEFLPVYTPNTAEKEDPKLYANNVRQLMAKALGIPVSDYTYDDCRLMTRAKQMNLPCAPCLVEVHRLRTKLGLTQKTVEEDLSKTPQLATICEGGISYQQFAHILGVCPKEEALQHLFKIYDKESNNSMDFREYLLGVLAISRVSNASEMLQLAFELFDSNRKGELTLPDATQALLHSTSMSPEDVHSMFTKIDTNLRGYITFEMLDVPTKGCDPSCTKVDSLVSACTWWCSSQSGIGVTRGGVVLSLVSACTWWCCTRSGIGVHVVVLYSVWYRRACGRVLSLVSACTWSCSQSGIGVHVVVLFSLCA
uniref:EF-hand domain-containing protein n=1 Tax=Timema tahoe TaxID=61484 RepID=A0A7R9IFY2_9NEOP|nr:unnamed protein product [Timema tahoe]